MVSTRMKTMTKRKNKTNKKYEQRALNIIQHSTRNKKSPQLMLLDSILIITTATSLFAIGYTAYLDWNPEDTVDSGDKKETTLPDVDVDGETDGEKTLKPDSESKPEKGEFLYVSLPKKTFRVILVLMAIGNMFMSILYLFGASSKMRGKFNFIEEYTGKKVSDFVPTKWTEIEAEVVRNLKQTAFRYGGSELAKSIGGIASNTIFSWFALSYQHFFGGDGYLAIVFASQTLLLFAVSIHQYRSRKRDFKDVVKEYVLGIIPTEANYKKTARYAPGNARDATRRKELQTRLYRAYIKRVGYYIGEGFEEEQAKVEASKEFYKQLLGLVTPERDMKTIVDAITMVHVNTKPDRHRTNDQFLELGKKNPRNVIEHIMQSTKMTDERDNLIKEANLHIADAAKAARLRRGSNLSQISVYVEDTDGKRE